ncbi:MAG: hypothetical protein WCF18_10460 [Chthoniobacteraceae bacterium]
MNWTRVILSGIGGVVATGPMTAAVVLWHRRCPTTEKYPLPPREITGQLLEETGVSTTAAQPSAATLIAHFVNGGAGGGMYGLIPAAKALEPISSGLLLGFFVWSLSYFGLPPALGILTPALKHPVRRNALMLGVHFIWGTCLCALHRLLLVDAGRVTPALREHLVPGRDTGQHVFLPTK